MMNSEAKKALFAREIYILHINSASRAQNMFKPVMTFGKEEKRRSTYVFHLKHSGNRA